MRKNSLSSYFSLKHSGKCICEEQLTLITRKFEWKLSAKLDTAISFMKWCPCRVIQLFSKRIRKRQTNCRQAIDPRSENQGLQSNHQPQIPWGRGSHLESIMHWNQLWNDRNNGQWTPSLPYRCPAALTESLLNAYAQCLR